MEQFSSLSKSHLDRDSQIIAHDLRLSMGRGEDITGMLNSELSKYRFYHELEVAQGIRTVGEPWAIIFQEAFREAVKDIDFTGKRVIDIGCRDGAMLFHAEEHGAKQLVGVDNDPSTGLANFLVPFRGSKISCFGGNIYDVLPKDTGKFDIVICCGLLYHLRYPMLGVKRLADLLEDGGILILETAILEAFEDMPLLFYPYRRESPYEGTSPSFLNMACLKNVFLQGALSTPEIRNRFHPIKFSLEKYFPGFYSSVDGKEMVIARTIVTAKKVDPPSEHLERYFEGQHRRHTTGNF